MSLGIDHIGIAVTSIEQSLVLYRDLIGLSVSSEEIVPDEQVKAALLPAGAIRVELLEPTSESSPIARFLAKHGPGLHHIALQVDDLTSSAKRLADSGYQLINEPKVGAGGHSYVFLHPRSTGGVLLELVERHHKQEGAV